MADPQNIQRVLAYLREHRAQHELEVLRAQLLQGGYSPADIDAALAQLQREEAPAEPAAPVEPLAAAAAAPVMPAGDALAGAERERALGQMVDYLRQHGAQYDLDALRRQLLSSGQSPEAVEEAIRRAALPPRAQRTGALAWPLGLGIAAINTFVVSPIAWALASALSASNDAFGILAVLPSLVVLAELIAGVVLLVRGERRRLGRALLWGVAFTITIPIILALLLLGICLAVLGGAGYFNP